MHKQLPIFIARNPLTIVLLILASVTMLVITEDSNQRASILIQRLGAIAENRLNLYDLTKGVLDAESGQRGYLLTGREEYLSPYNAALKNIDATFSLLDAAYSHETRSAALLKKLHALTETKLSELALTIQMLKDGRRQTGQVFTLSGIGQENMDAIRTTNAELLKIEARRLQSSREDVSNILLYSQLGVGLLTTFSFLLVLLNMRQTQAFKVQQEKHQEAMHTEHQRLQSEVVRRTAQLVELNDHLQSAREDERHHIARDLHDELGALLTSAKLDVARIKSRLGGTAPEASERLAHLVETLNAGIAMKRRIIDDLWPSTLGDLGLVATLEILAREFSKSVNIPVHCTLQTVLLDSTAELMIYRLVQEATTNIAKYASAQNVWLSLENQGKQLEVTVRDDGIGFDVSQIGSKAHGLLGMRYRVEAEGGTLEVVSTQGQGTVVRARLPTEHTLSK